MTVPARNPNKKRKESSMKTISKLFTATVLTAFSVMPPLQAQISLAQADSIAKAYLRENWLPEWEEWLPFRLWVNTQNSDTLYLFDDPAQFVTNSYLYILTGSNPGINMVGPEIYFSVDKTSGLSKATSGSYIPLDLQHYRISDYCWETECPKTMTYEEANRVISDSIELRYGANYPNAYTVYAYPDTSTMGASWSFMDRNNLQSSTWIAWEPASTPPEYNLFFYFFIEEKNDSLWTSLMSVSRTADSSIYLSKMSDPALYEVPIDLWTYPVIYTHLRQVSNESFPETASTAQAGRLFPNVPNPFSSVTRIRYSLPESCRSAELQILDLQGRLVQRIALDRNGNDEAEISLDGHAPGLYIGILLVDGIPADRIRLLKAE